jgi:hypothetical protein
MKKITLRKIASYLIFAFWIVFSFTINGYTFGDKALTWLNLQPWSKTISGFHYTAIYSLIMIILAYIIGLKNPIFTLKKLIKNKYIVIITIILVRLVIIN